MFECQRFDVKQMSKRIRGVLAPVVTPFKTDLSPDRKRFIRHCQWLLSQNCGLTPFGTTSEANSMSTDEHISLAVNCPSCNEQIEVPGSPA